MTHATPLSAPREHDIRCYDSGALKAFPSSPRVRANRAGETRQKAVIIVTDLTRGPLKAVLLSIPSLPDSTLFSDHGLVRGQPTDLDMAQTQEWETQGGACDTAPPLRLALAPSASLRHVAETYDQKLEWTRLAFAAAQARWEARPQEVGPVTRDDEAEEPASKAAGNRERVAFLSVKGATMQG